MYNDCKKIGFFAFLIIVLINYSCMLLFAQEFSVERLKDQVTGRTVLWYKSPYHENHNYYDISPWDIEEKRLVFFQFDKSVGKLKPEGSSPGSLWIMDVDGGNRKKIVDGLSGSYHTSVGQLWGAGGTTVIFRDNSNKRRGMGIVNVETGERDYREIPVPADRISPDFKKISCVNGKQWGIYDLVTKSYTKLVTLDRALALSPNKELAKNKLSHLQNTRFSPDGNKIIIVHRTSEDFPTLVEVFVYDFITGDLIHLASDLHHPNWRPDGKVILFVRRDPHTNTQTLWEVDVVTKEERCIFNQHVPAGHPSYHPLKPHLIVTDCYGGNFGYGLALINLRTQEIKQLITIPLGSKPPEYPDTRFPFRNWHIWFPPRPYLNEPRPVWNKDGTKILCTSEESGHMNLYVVDTSDL